MALISAGRGPMLEPIPLPVAYFPTMALREDLPTFRLEEYLGVWEFGAPHYLTGSDAETLAVEELLDLGGGEARELFAALPLSYAPTWGGAELLGGGRRPLRGARSGARADLRRRRGGALLGAAGAGRARRSRARHRPQLPVLRVDADRRPGPRSRGSCSTRGRAGRSTSRRSRPSCGRRRSSSRSTFPTTRRAPSPTVPPSRRWRRSATSTGRRCFSDEVYRGLEARGGRGAATGGRALRHGRSR